MTVAEDAAPEVDETAAVDEPITDGISPEESQLRKDAKDAIEKAEHLRDALWNIAEFAENIELQTQVDELLDVLAGIEAYTRTEKDQSSFHLKQDDLISWQKVGGGGFSNVFSAKYKGSVVAIKVLNPKKDDAKDQLQIHDKAQIIEGRLLRSLSHENIVAFRGMGQLSHAIGDLRFSSQIFIVMEHIPDTVHRYVKRRSTYETKGLSPRVVWDFAQQIALGLAYLHTLSEPLKPIAHRDLKPDNLLLDPSNMKIKLADFGLALNDIYGGDKFLFNVRWASPELWEDVLIPQNLFESGQEPDLLTDVEPSEQEEDPLSQPEESDPWTEEDYFATDYYMAVDIYAYGLVLAFCLTGQLPFDADKATAVLGKSCTYKYEEAVIQLPQNLTGPLQKLITDCIQKRADGRPANAQNVVENYFQDPTNPYLQDPATAEFFCCGFMKDTSIFVADSLVNEESRGYFTTGVYPGGYPARCLVCEVDTRLEQGKVFPETPVDTKWNKMHKYNEGYAKFKQQAIRKVIDDNPTVPLRYLLTSREGEEEEQEVVLRFAQGTYVHHRAMRDVWRSLTEEEKSNEVPCKMAVHPAYSTSFGLHVAVITADTEPRFLFCRRSIREGMSSPGKYTCGAVESVSVKDYVTLPEEPDKKYVSLLKTAARGLSEELQVEINDDELDAIRLSTIYLKYDTHEWGLCGFVNLADERIAPQRRLTCEALRFRFTNGPKDKFEHNEIHDVDFTMDSMMRFIQENQNDFASSGKLVAVKVMQAFFGLHAVELAFSAVLGAN